MKAMPKNAKQVAEEAMPGWKAVEEQVSFDALADHHVDSAGVDLDRLKRKYFGESAAARDSTLGAAARRGPNDADQSELVIMEPADGRDASVGRKTVVVHGEKIVGTQG